jgi:nitrite reductase/ring-hydroxylating ferredoxin subunit
MSLTIIKIGSEVFAISDQCPHWGLPLKDAWLHRYEDTDKFGWSIVCPQHGMRFSLKTGENVEDLLGGGDGSSYKLKTYDCKIKDGKICVRM